MKSTIAQSKKASGATNIKALSQAIGVSVGTISNVFNRPQIVSEKTRKKVLDAAADFDYKPDYFARGLSGGKTMTIGLVTGLGNKTAVNQTSSITRAAEEQGYLIHTIDTDKRGDDSTYLIKRMQDLLDRKVDGLIIARPRPLADKAIEFLSNCPVPVVLVSPAPSMDILNQVVLDMDKAIDRLARHLYELGHRRVAFFPSNESYDYLDHKIRPYQRAFLKRGIDFVTGHNLEIDKSALNLSDVAYRAVTKYLKEDSSVTALLMNNDIGATGALAAARDMGLKVPDDISIAGFDNLDGVQYYNPPLTTIAPPGSKQIGSAVFNMIHSLIETPEEKVENKVFPFNLIPRESTGKSKGLVTRDLGLVEKSCLSNERKTNSRMTAPKPAAATQQETIASSTSDSYTPSQTFQHQTEVFTVKPI